MKIGMAADMGSLNRLPKLIGNSSWLHDVCFTARNFDAQEAHRYSNCLYINKNKDSDYNFCSEIRIAYELLCLLHFLLHTMYENASTYENRSEMIRSNKKTSFSLSSEVLFKRGYDVFVVTELLLMHYIIRYVLQFV